MELSSKAIRFIVEALDYRIKSYEESLNTQNLNSDEASDIANDAMYLEAIRKDMVKTLTQTGEKREVY